MALKLTGLADRICDEGASAWDVHVRARAAQQAGADVVVMSVGDNKLPTHESVINTAIEAMRKGDTHYVDSHGTLSFRSAVADYLSGQFGYGVSADNITITAGTQNALFTASCLLLEHGDEVIVADPMFVTYSATLSAMGAKIVRLPCPAALGFHPDLSTLDNLVSNKTKAIFFASPVNPTGVIFTDDELATIARFAEKHDLWVVSDEVYAGLVLEGKSTSMAAMPGMKQRCITIGSLSKSHSMTGWRIGWACGPDAFSQAAAALALANTYGLPGFLQEAGVTALGLSSDKLCALYRGLLDIAMDELSALANVTVLRPQSGMFVLLPVAPTGLSSAEFVEKLYLSTGVSVLDAELFGTNLKDMVRITFALDEAELRKGLKRIVTFYKSQTT